MALLAEEVAPKPEDGLHLCTEVPRRGLLGNSVSGPVLAPKHEDEKGLCLKAATARAVRLPLGPVSLALLSYSPFVGRRIVHEGDGRVRNLGVPAAIVADERYTDLAT
jgi:hypothetical protein